MKANLTEVETIAVAGALKGAADAKKHLAPGRYSGEVAVKVRYTVDRAEDTDAAPTANILSVPVLARAVVAMGATGDAFLAALEKAALEALADGAAVADAVEADSRVAARVADIQKKVVAKLPRQPKSGATRVSATVEVLAAEQMPLAA